MPRYITVINGIGASSKEFDNEKEAVEYAQKLIKTKEEKGQTTTPIGITDGHENSQAETKIYVSEEKTLLNSGYHKCVICGKWSNRGYTARNGETANGEHVCAECFNDKTKLDRCQNCGKYFIKGTEKFHEVITVIHEDGQEEKINICNKCYERIAFTCDECGKTFIVDQVTKIALEGEVVCNYCYKDKVHRYRVIVNDEEKEKAESLGVKVWENVALFKTYEEAKEFIDKIGKDIECDEGRMRDSTLARMTGYEDFVYLGTPNELKDLNFKLCYECDCWHHDNDMWTCQEKCSQQTRNILN